MQTISVSLFLPYLKMDLKQFAPYVAKRVTDFMHGYIDTLDDKAPNLKESMKYALLLGGKRARPLLVYATGKLVGQKEESLDYVAAAIECVHSYSLIHDDMPEMDNDTLRRGHATVHVKFGQAGALLAGDALQALGFEFLSDPSSKLSAQAVSSLTRLLAVNAGYSGMCGGQAIDLASEKKHIGLDELKVLHSKKTGALIKAAVLMGANSVDGVSQDALNALESYARWTGLAFQVWDDVLDVIGDTSVMGKNQGSDELLEKSTYPSLLGIDAAKEFAFECADKAKKALLDPAIDGDVSILTQFADFTVNRDH